MKFIYPAVFRKTEKGTFYGYLPDLACCEVEAPDLDEAIEKANHAAYDWIELELSEEVVDLPPVSEPEDLELQEGDLVRYISVNIRMFDGWDE